MRRSLSAEEKLGSCAADIKRGCNNLITLQIDLTDFCVCKCKGCEHWKWPIKTKLDTSVLEENVFPFLESNKSVQSVVFSGGEPLLHPDVEKIAAVLNEVYDLSVGIITSGLGKARLDLRSLSEHCEWIRFSTDGFTPDNYASTRGVSLFGDWTSNLVTLVEHNRSTGCSTRLNVTIHEYNVDNFADNLINFLVQNKLDIEVYFWLSREFIEMASESRLQQKEKIIQQIKNLIADATVLGYPPNLLNFNNVSRHFTLQDPVKYHSCFVPQMFSLIAADGNVFPCCYMYEPVFSITKQQLQFVIGNINESTLFDIYNSQRYRDVVEQFRNCDKRYQQCKFCDRFDHLNKYLNDYKPIDQSVFL